MIDRRIIPGAARDAIRAFNNDPQGLAAYVFVDAEGEIVGEVEGIWQILDFKPNNQPGFEISRPGGQRIVFKTDLESENQPEKGWIIDIDGSRWEINKGPSREGLFNVWDANQY